MDMYASNNTEIQELKDRFNLNEFQISRECIGKLLIKCKVLYKCRQSYALQVNITEILTKDIMSHQSQPNSNFFFHKILFSFFIQ